MDQDYIKPYVYEGENFYLKHDDDNNIIIEFDEQRGGINVEYPVHNMTTEDIKEEERYMEEFDEGGWEINFLPTAKIHSKWKYIMFSDNSSGFEITNEDTGETKFYTENQQGFDVTSDDGDVLYEACIINESCWPIDFIVGFVRKEDLNPRSSYYPGNG